MKRCTKCKQERQSYEPGRNECRECTLKYRRLQKLLQKKRACEVIQEAKCKYCPEENIRALQFDHIHNDGFKERGVRRYGEGSRNAGLSLISLVLKMDPTTAKNKYQVLCASCHAIKTATVRAGEDWVQALERRRLEKQKPVHETLIKEYGGAS